MDMACDITVTYRVRAVNAAGGHIYLFNTSLRENIRMARRDATDADVAAQTEAAHRVSTG